MANQSILAAFERMWQHIVAALGEKQPVGDYVLKEELPEIPVTSVNNMTGDVLIDIPEIPYAVEYIEQSLTDEQKAQARENIEAEYKNTIYYTSLSQAITDINNGVSDNAISNIVDAKIKVFASNTGRTVVMLINGDIEETEQITIYKDIDLILNGHTISFSKAGKLRFETGTNCTIDGTASGSTLAATLNTIDNTSIYYIVIGKGDSLHIKGGTYTVDGETVKMCGAVVFGDTSKDNSIRDAIISVNNASTILTTNVAGILNQTGIAKTKVVNCNVSVTCAATNCSVKAIHNDDAGGYLECIDTTIDVIDSATPSGTKIIGGITVDPDTTTIIDNCTITIDHPSLVGEPDGGGLAVYGSTGGSNGLIKIKNSTLTGVAAGVFSYEGFEISVNSSIIKGYITAMVTAGNLILNDCTLINGCYSGIYDQASAIIKTVIQLNNATTNYNAHMDNCIIEENGYKSVTSNSATELYVSNCNYARSADQLWQNAGFVYLGTGNNFETRYFASPNTVISTGKIYRRILDEAICDGEDFNALVNYTNNQPVIPATTAEDEGKFLRFVNGQIVWTAVSSAEGVSF